MSDYDAFDDYFAQLAAEEEAQRWADYERWTTTPPAGFPSLSASMVILCARIILPTLLIRPISRTRRPVGGAEDVARCRLSAVRWRP